MFKFWMVILNWLNENNHFEMDKIKWLNKWLNKIGFYEIVKFKCQF